MSAVAEPGRAGRLQRLLAVQSRKRSVAEWRLAQLQGERAEIERREVEIIEALNHEGALHGLFLEGKVKALKRNEIERRRVGALIETAEAKLVAARRLEKGVEKAEREARRLERDLLAKKELDAVLERFVGRGRDGR